MGSGIAHVCALAGLPVRLLDAKPEALERARAVMARNMDRQVAKGTIAEADKTDALARIAASTDYATLGDADLVIEAATEKEEIKRAIYKAMTPHLRPECMLASNTSSISITRLGAATDRPEKFIGMHFMNPVPVMKLVEVIRGIATDEPTFQAIQALAARLHKTTSVAEDFPAFIVNRILVPMINEAVYGHRDRHGDEAGCQPPDGAARAGRLHRLGHVPLDHAGALRGLVRQQVPALSAAGEVCRGRLVRPQDQPRLLRLQRHPAASDAVGSSGRSTSS
jgi:3-hydroxybutyryl-CoA dehydrogenase